MKSNKHIVIFTPGFAANESDLNCIPPLQSFILSLKENKPGTDISIISFQYPFKKSIYEWHNIQVYAVGGSNKKSLHRIITWVQVFFYFLKINRKKKVTTIHAFWLTECAWMGYLIGKLFKINTIATVPGQDATAENKYLRFIKGIQLKVVCCSLFVAEVLKKSSDIDPVKIIPYGINEEDLIFFKRKQQEISTYLESVILEALKILKYL